MQTATLALHVVGCLLALYIYFRNPTWKYFALMLLFSNGIGVLFYVLVLIGVSHSHELSQLRSLIQAIILLMFSMSLADGKANE